MDTRKEFKEPATSHPSATHTFTSIKISSTFMSTLELINRFKGISATSFAGFDTECRYLYLINPFTDKVTSIPYADEFLSVPLNLPQIESVDETRFACIRHNQVELRCVETGEINKSIPLSYPKADDNDYQIVSVKKSPDGNFLLILVNEIVDPWKFYPAYHKDNSVKLSYDQIKRKLQEMALDDGFHRDENKSYKKSHIFIVDVESGKTLYIQPKHLVSDLITIRNDQLILALKFAGINIINFDVEAQIYHQHSDLLLQDKVIKEVYAADGKLITYACGDQDGMFDDVTEVLLHSFDLSSEPGKISQTKKITRIDDLDEFDTTKILPFYHSVVYKVDDPFEVSSLHEYHFGTGADKELHFAGKSEVNIFCKLSDGTLVLACRDHENKPEFIFCKLANMNEYKAQYAKELKQKQDTLTTQIDLALQPKVHITRDVLSIISRLAVPDRLGLFSERKLESDESQEPRRSEKNFTPSV